jgi:hypothetical protein
MSQRNERSTQHDFEAATPDVRASGTAHRPQWSWPFP